MRILFLLLLFSGMGQIARAQSSGDLEVLGAFVEQFAQGRVENAEMASAAYQERVGNEARPGIYLHPRPREDASIRFDAIPAIPLKDGEHLLLRFDTGIRDGVDWKSEANGVRFRVLVNGETVHESTLHDSTWEAHTVVLDQFAGSPMQIAFCTNAVDGNTAYDWALYGDPLLLHFRPHATLRTQEPDVEITLSSEKTLWGFHAPAIRWGEPALSTPIVHVGASFRLIQEITNEGRGRSAASDVYLILNAALGSDEGKVIRRSIPPMAAGASHRVDWPLITAERAGLARIEVKPVGDDAGAKSLSLTVFPSDLSAETLLEEENTARLQLIDDKEGAAYLVAEVYQEDSWERVADLYPLVEGIWSASGEATMRTDRLMLEQVTAPDLRDDPVILRGNLGGHPTELRIRNAGGGAFEMTTVMNTAAAINLYALRTPQILPWNHTPGPDKDYAIFPGLEYLEGEEHSSSLRDLAAPLNEREVPAIHKIATPLMAVAHKGALVGTGWNARQEWRPGEAYPAARFLVPKMDSGFDAPILGLAAPSVGNYLRENSWVAATPVPVDNRRAVSLTQHLILRVAKPDEAKGANILHAFDKYFEHYPMLPASAQPRGWPQSKQLALDGYFNAVWNEDPPGFKHCYGWNPGPFTGHIVPLLMLKADGVPPHTAAEIDRRVDAVLARGIEEEGAGQLWRSAGCHIVLGELPFYRGYLPEALGEMRQHARNLLDAREEGHWRWHPGGEKYESLGIDGDHTLGQAARNSLVVLRAARLSADPELAKEGLDAMRQMELYGVPRGAQTWECPLYQPDILAAGYAIRAYCEAYRMTGDPGYLEQAQYWARTGLPFLYLWEMPDYPTMRYNVISVMGSTFYTHSWIGLPVVWCGLVYAYALQDLRELDGSSALDWSEVAQGITHSAMWQQYTEGENRGTYPDSWNMVENAPKPADINPENIVMNAMRLRGNSPEVNFRRLQFQGRELWLNAPAEIVADTVAVQSERITIEFQNPRDLPIYALVGPIAAPELVEVIGDPYPASIDLANAPEGWQYSAELEALIIKLPASRNTTVKIAVPEITP